MSRSRFEGKVAIVTGGSMGIGKSAVLQLVSEGAPGAVDTPGLNAAILKNESVKKIITDAIPMQRAATPEEVANAICFLASDEASFVTGVILPVDGGKAPQLYVPAFDITNLDNQAADR